jgi:hypothetical protein
MKRLGQGPIEKDVSLLRVLLGKCGLAQPHGWLPFAVYQAVPYGLTGNTNIYIATTSRNCTIRSWSQSVKVNTTNNGSNCWVLRLFTLGGALLISEVNTAALTPTAWGVVSDTSIDYALSTSHLGVFLQAIQYGSPGPLYTGGPAVFVT